MVSAVGCGSPLRLNLFAQPQVKTIDSVRLKFDVTSVQIKEFDSLWDLDSVDVVFRSVHAMFQTALGRCGKGLWRAMGESQTPRRGSSANGLTRASIKLYE